MYIQTTFELKEFLLKKPKELLELFSKHNILTVKIRTEEITLTMSPGMAFGIDFCNVIVLRHAKSVPPPRHTPDEDWTVQVLFQRLMIPTDVKKAIEKFKLYSKNHSEGKKTVIPELTRQDFKQLMSSHQ